MIEHRFRDYIVRFYDRHSGISLDVILSARALPGFISSRGGGYNWKSAFALRRSSFLPRLYTGSLCASSIQSV